MSWLSSLLDNHLGTLELNLAVDLYTQSAHSAQLISWGRNPPAPGYTIPALRIAASSERELRTARTHYHRSTLPRSKHGIFVLQR